MAIACFSDARSLLKEGIILRPLFNNVVSVFSSNLEDIFSTLGLFPNPFLFSPWQTAHCSSNNLFPAANFVSFLISFFFTAFISIIQGISLLLTHKMERKGSTAEPPHSPPPSNPG